MSDTRRRDRKQCREFQAEFLKLLLKNLEPYGGFITDTTSRGNQTHREKIAVRVPEGKLFGLIMPVSSAPDILISKTIANNWTPKPEEDIRMHDGQTTWRIWNLEPKYQNYLTDLVRTAVATVQQKNYQANLNKWKPKEETK